MAEERGELKRRARFAVNLQVEYQSPESRNLNENEEEAWKEIYLPGILLNISSEGACIETAHPLKVNEILKISIPIQSVISDFIKTPRTLVEVKWSSSQNDKHLAGLQYLL